jgi:CBS domain-containing protein
MKTIRELLHEKGDKVWTIAPDTSVYHALEEMAQHGIGSLVVVENGRPVGLISEREYSLKVALKGRSSRDTQVRDIMTRRVAVATPSETIEECMALMTEKRVRHLPVIEDGKLVGLVSIGDLVKAIISEQQFIIEQLEHYITG